MKLSQTITLLCLVKILIYLFVLLVGDKAILEINVGLLWGIHLGTLFIKRIKSNPSLEEVRVDVGPEGAGAAEVVGVSLPMTVAPPILPLLLLLPQLKLNNL